MVKEAAWEKARRELSLRSAAVAAAKAEVQRLEGELAAAAVVEKDMFKAYSAARMAADS